MARAKRHYLPAWALNIGFTQLGISAIIFKSHGASSLLCVFVVVTNRSFRDNLPRRFDLHEKQKLAPHYRVRPTASSRFSSLYPFKNKPSHYFMLDM
jgi:hypothetical protein